MQIILYIVLLLFAITISGINRKRWSLACGRVAKLKTGSIGVHPRMLPPPSYGRAP
jgi:hypothetical protein